MLKIFFVFYFIGFVFFLSAIMFLDRGYASIALIALAIPSLLILKYLRKKYAYKGVAPEVTEDPYKDLEEKLAQEDEDD
jgi:hypothetical protein